jgi:hypothetical protein
MMGAKRALRVSLANIAIDTTKLVYGTKMWPDKAENVKN